LIAARRRGCYTGAGQRPGSGDLRVTIIDLAERGPTRDLFKRKMSPSFASIMPQVAAVWCEELGHEVRYLCYTGFEDVAAMADETDVLILGAFTLSAHAAYTISAIYRAKGAVTALGGPHARCYPEDAARYFDYVLGLTGRPELEELLREAAPHRPLGRRLSAARQPPGIPSLRQRWKFVEATLAISGAAKVRQIADHVNMILRHISFVQTNFILGLDCDEGDEPFELTKQFLDLAPGAYPAFSLFTSYGRASSLNLELQRAGRINAMAFHFLDSNHGMNIRPLNYAWPDFYDRVADVTRHALGARGNMRRLAANRPGVAGLFNLIRGATTGRPVYQAAMASMLRVDRSVRA
jgi:hypothetical protein